MTGRHRERSQIHYPSLSCGSDRNCAAREYGIKYQLS